MESLYNAIRPTFGPEGPGGLLIPSVFPCDVCTVRCNTPQDSVPGPAEMFDCEAGRQKGSHFKALKLRCESNTDVHWATLDSRISPTEPIALGYFSGFKYVRSKKIKRRNRIDGWCIPNR